GFIELDEQLSAYVARNVAQPRQVSAKLSELASLIEGSRIDTTSARQAELSLLESEIPEKAKRGLPSAQTLLLLAIRINPELVAPLAPHERNLIWSMAKARDFRTGRHVVYQLQAHLVFIPKYRRGVISERAFVTLREAWQQVCKDFECDLEESGWESDHVHLLVAYPPKVALSRLVNSLKGVSARRLRTANLPEVRAKLWGAHFWSPSYCAVSAGGAPLEIVKQYVNKKRGRASSPP